MWSAGPFCAEYCQQPVAGEATPCAIPAPGVQRASATGTVGAHNPTGETTVLWHPCTPSCSRAILQHSWVQPQPIPAQKHQYISGLNPASGTNPASQCRRHSSLMCLPAPGHNSPQLTQLECARNPWYPQPVHSPLRLVYKYVLGTYLVPSNCSSRGAVLPGIRLTEAAAQRCSQRSLPMTQHAANQTCCLPHGEPARLLLATARLSSALSAINKPSHQHLQHTLVRQHTSLNQQRVSYSYMQQLHT